jgi:hypothetical protein
MAKTTTVTLGDTDFQISMLTIGQLRAISAEVAEEVPTKGRAEEVPTKGRAKEEFYFDQAVKVIAWGLSSPQKQYTPEEISALPANSVSEIFEARSVILRHAGLIKEDKKPGEGRAEAS